MPLDGDRPSRVVGPLKSALDRLTEPFDLGGRAVRFLEGYQWPFEGDGWDQVVRVWFHGRSHLDGLRALKARLAAGGGEGLPPAVARVRPRTSAPRARRFPEGDEAPPDAQPCSGSTCATPHRRPSWPSYMGEVGRSASRQA